MIVIGSAKTIATRSQVLGTVGGGIHATGSATGAMPVSGTGLKVLPEVPPTTPIAVALIEPVGVTVAAAASVEFTAMPHWLPERRAVFSTFRAEPPDGSSTMKQYSSRASPAVARPRIVTDPRPKIPAKKVGT